MIVIKNKFIPFGGYKAITIWPFIFTKGDLSNVDLNHEKIHGRQQLELLVIFFYIIYGIEYLLKKYRQISFEKEAYKYQGDLTYLENRPWYNMWRE